MSFSLMREKYLGFWDSIAINVGIVIDAGVFRTPGKIALKPIFECDCRQKQGSFARRRRALSL